MSASWLRPRPWDWEYLVVIVPIFMIAGILGLVFWGIKEDDAKESACRASGGSYECSETSGWVGGQYAQFRTCACKPAR